MTWAPQPDRRGDRAAMLTAAVIGVVALLAVLGVALFTSDKAARAGGPLADHHQQVVGPGPQPTDGPALGSSGATTGKGMTLAQFKAEFPLPPGSTPTKLPAGSAPGEKVYLVRTPLASVKSFYETKLATLGVQWADPLTTTDSAGKIVGWHGSMYLPGQGAAGLLSLDENLLGNTPGKVTIDVEFE